MTRHASGRPVRFFVLLMGGWATIRVASSMLAGDSAAIPRQHARAPARAPQEQTVALADAPATASPPTTRIDSVAGPSPLVHPSRARVMAHAIMIPMPATREASGNAAAFTGARPTPDRLAMDPAATSSTNSAAPSVIATTAPAATAQDSPAAIPLAPPAHPASDRWRGSAWLLWREGSATPANAATVGRLGGSQAGLRLDYDLTPRAAGRVAAYGRVSTALNRPASPEAALGLAWQPARSVPISLAAERRISLGKGARDANALIAVGGFGPTPLALGLEAEAYAQAGMVGFRSRDLFADGKFSLLSPIGHSPLRVGASLSGGAQPQVERLDIGPEVQVRLPLPRMAARLGVEWRERIAGRAAPASGLAVTLGTDF